jgi:hypothetical protein
MEDITLAKKAFFVMTINGAHTGLRPAAMLALLLAISGCAGTATTGPAQTGSSPKSMGAINSLGVEDATNIPGTCQRLVLVNEDLTSGCSGMSMISNTSNGRLQISAFLNTGSTAMFSGTDLPNPDANTDAIKIDRIYLNSAGKPGEPVILPATGTCTYTNPYSAPLKVSCRVTAYEESYRYDFLASGLMK